MLWQSVAATAVAVLVLALPGLVVLAPLRGGLIPRFALASVCSVASIGVAGVVFGALGMRFEVWQPFVPALALALGTWLARRWVHVGLPRDDGKRLLLVASWLGAAVTIAMVMLSGLQGFDRISQTYDNVFHLSAVASILQDGDASSLTLRTIIETDRTTAFYPSAWHSVVALVAKLTGVEIAVAANATWLAVAAVVWLPGAAWLAQVCLHRYPAAQIGMVALPLGAAFGWMPYALLTWGTLYPTFLATALLPAAVAIPAAIWIRLRNAHAPARVILVGTAALGIALSAIVFAQPRVLASWLVIVAVPAFGVLSGSMVRLWRRGGRARQRMLWIVAAVTAVALLAAGGATVYAVTVLGPFDRPLDSRLGGPQAQATQSVVSGLWQVLTVSTPTGVAGTITSPALLLAAMVLMGCVIAVRTRSLGWVVYAYAALAILFALAAGSDHVVSKLLTAIWYKDRFRLSATLPVMGVVLAALGVVTLARWLRGRLVRSATAVSDGAGLGLVVTWVVTIASAVALSLTGQASAIATVFRLPESSAQTAVVSQSQIDFLARLGEQIPDDQLVLGDPWDGSALSWVFGDREPVFPHVNGQWDADRQVLAWNLADVGSDSRVCEALDRLRVRYVVYHPHAFGVGDQSGNHFPGPHQAVERGLLSEVATDGDSTLYRIDQCGPLP